MLILLVLFSEGSGVMGRSFIFFLSYMVEFRFFRVWYGRELERFFFRRGIYVWVFRECILCVVFAISLVLGWSLFFCCFYFLGFFVLFFVSC